MSKTTVKSYSTLDEWNSAFFPAYVSKTLLVNFEGNPSALAEALAEEALKNASIQLSGIKKHKRTVSLHK